VRLPEWFHVGPWWLIKLIEPFGGLAIVLMGCFSRKIALRKQGPNGISDDLDHCSDGIRNGLFRGIYGIGTGRVSVL